MAQLVCEELTLGYDRPILTGLSFEASGSQAFGDLPGMSGAAGCAVHIDAVRSDIQRLNALIEQH